MLNLLVGTEQLENTFKKLEAVIPKKPSSQILKSVKLEVDKDKLILTSSDSVNTVISELDVTVINDGNLIINGVNDLMKSFKFFKESQTRLKISKSNKHHLEITNGDKRLLIPYTNINSYPDLKLDNIEYTEEVKYHENTLYQRIMKVNYARFKDNSRPTLKGIRFNKSDMVALDGARLALSLDDTLYINNSFTINEDMVSILRKTLNRRKNTKPENNEIIIKISDEYVNFKFDGIELISKLDDSDYFDYESILPKDTESVKFNKKKLEDNLKFLYIHSKEHRNNLIEFKLEKDNCKIISNSVNSIVESDIEIDNDLEFSNHINNKFLLDALKVIKSDDVIYKYTNGLNPITLSDENSIHLILPVRAS